MKEIDKNINKKDQQFAAVNMSMSTNIKVQSDFDRVDNQIYSK